MPKDMLFCGFELRRSRRKDLTVYHCQDMSWKQFTFLSQKEPTLDGAGGFYSLKEENQKKVRPHYPWRCKEPGVGPVRGYSVTYSPRFGVQAWVFVELRLPEGYRNMPVLAGQGKVAMKSKGDFQEYWEETLDVLQEDFPIGLHRFIEFNPRTNRYKFLEEDHEGYEFGKIQPPSPSQPELGAESSGELSTSPAR